MNGSDNFFERISSFRMGIIIIAMQTVFFIPLGLTRLIDGDEGFYILAAKYVLEGKHPYLDFFYPQMPLLPYVYGFWMKIFGISWYSARCLSAVFAIIIGYLIFYYVSHALKRKDFGILALILYMLSGLTLGWNTVVKTYALSTLFLFAAYLIQAASLHMSFEVRYFISGFFLGMAVNTRLFFIAALPGLMFGFPNDTPQCPFFRRWLYLFFGIAIALLPNLFFIFSNSDAYYFGNIGFHAIRTDEGIIGAIPQKIRIALGLIGISRTEWRTGFQCAVLILFAIYHFISDRSEQKPADSTMYIAILLITVSLLPTPTYTQYFVVIIPFLIVIAVFGIENMLRRTDNKKQLSYIFIIIIVCYLTTSVGDIYRYTVSGKDVAGISTAENSINWQISTVRQVTAKIDEYNPKKNPVINCWPGYFVESESLALHGMENHFSMFVAPKLSEENRRKYNIISYKELEKILIHEEYPILLGNCFFSTDKLKEQISNIGYVRTDKIYDSEIWLKIPAASKEKP